MLAPDEKLFLKGHFVTGRGRINRAYTGKYGFGIFRTERKRTKNFQRAQVCKTAVTLRRPHRHCSAPPLSLRYALTVIAARHPRHCEQRSCEANQPRPSSLRRTTPRHCEQRSCEANHAASIVIASSEARSKPAASIVIASGEARCKPCL